MKQKGFTQAPLFSDINDRDSKTVTPIKVTEQIQSIKSGAGFTLIELLVVISIIGFLASVILIAFNSARFKARDAKRVADIRQIVSALSFYYDENDSSYPPVNPAAQGAGGWEVSYNAGFLSALSKYLSPSPKDPINGYDGGSLFTRAGSYYYAYYNYPASSAPGYGCAFNAPFAVIGITKLEVGPNANTPKAQCGVFPPGGCTGGGIPNVCRDWSTEFDYSVLLVK